MNRNGKVVDAHLTEPTQIMCFSCTEPSNGITPAIRLDRDLPVEAPGSRADLLRISARHKKVLLLGVCDWSNYSHFTLRNLVEHVDRFEAEGIRLATFCLEEATGEMLCPETRGHWHRVKTEPLMLMLMGGTLQRMRFGPLPAECVLSWMSWDGLGVSPVPEATFSVHRIFHPLWDRDLDGWR